MVRKKIIPKDIYLMAKDNYDKLWEADTLLDKKIYKILIFVTGFITFLISITMSNDKLLERGYVAVTNYGPIEIKIYYLILLVSLVSFSKMISLIMIFSNTRTTPLPMMGRLDDITNSDTAMLNNSKRYVSCLPTIHKNNHIKGNILKGLMLLSQRTVIMIIFLFLTMVII
jgi:hypothetical protein